MSARARLASSGLRFAPAHGAETREAPARGGRFRMHVFLASAFGGDGVGGCLNNYGMRAVTAICWRDSS